MAQMSVRCIVACSKYADQIPIFILPKLIKKKNGKKIAAFGGNFLTQLRAAFAYQIAADRREVAAGACGIRTALSTSS